MKILTVDTGDNIETFEVSDKAILSILDGGQLWCDDDKKNIIAYAAGRFISARLEPVEEEAADE